MYAIVLPASTEDAVKKLVEKSGVDTIVVQELVPHFCTVYDVRFFLDKIGISAYHSIPNGLSFEEHGGHYEFTWMDSKENLNKSDKSLVQFLITAHKEVLEKICRLLAKKLDLKFFA